MRIHNLFEDEAGVSHFRDVELRWEDVRGASELTRKYPAAGIIMRETTKDYDAGRHPAPRRQYIINLDAGVNITAGDGETRYIGPGEAVMVEDPEGKGEISKFVADAMRHSTVLAVE